MHNYTLGPWRRGITLKTPETYHWTSEQVKANNAVERCMVFSNFSNDDDDGRSRRIIATCVTEIHILDKIYGDRE